MGEARCHVPSRPLEKECDHLCYLIYARESISKFTLFKSVYKFSDFPIVEKLILSVIHLTIYEEKHQRRSNDEETSQWKLTVTICSASGNRSAAKNQPVRINGAKSLSSRNRGNMEIAIPHPAFRIQHAE